MKLHEKEPIQVSHKILRVHDVLRLQLRAKLPDVPIVFLVITILVYIWTRESQVGLIFPSREELSNPSDDDSFMFTLQTWHIVSKYLNYTNGIFGKGTLPTVGGNILVEDELKGQGVLLSFPCVLS